MLGAVQGCFPEEVASDMCTAELTAALLARAHL